MERYEVTIERVRDNKRFKRVIPATSPADAIRQAYALTANEPDDFYVISVNPIQ